MCSLIDEYLPTPAFCSFESGCETLAGSAFARPLGIPLPLIGVLGFTTCIILSLIPGRQTQVVLEALALTAGAAGLGLLLVQALVLHRFCTLCLIADACGMSVALFQLLANGTDSYTPRSVPRGPWLGLTLLAVCVPFALAIWRANPATPAAVSDYWKDGTITLVLITDFQCDHCRGTHDVLERFLNKEQGRFQLVTLALPLPVNPNSRLAARAWWCAREQGQGPAMANALFQAKDMSPDALERIAEQLKLDLNKHRECISDAKLDTQIDASTAWLDRRQFRGLPLLWVQDQLLSGVFSETALRDAYRRAARRTSQL
jgi:predicted DsbA family dithiol-disulfide isomerase